MSSHAAHTGKEPSQPSGLDDCTPAVSDLLPTELPVLAAEVDWLVKLLDEILAGPEQ